MSGDLWRCEDCGWIWPLKRAPYQDTDCDACGGTMAPEEQRPAATGRSWKAAHSKNMDYPGSERGVTDG